MIMKKRINKLVSSILVLAFLLSAFSTLAFASVGSSAEEVMATAADDDIELLINRPFDEGWSYENGFGTTRVGNHKYTIEYEEDEDYNYNYFCRLDSTSGAVGYLELNYGKYNPRFEDTVFEIDLKTDDLCNFGSPIIYFTSPDAEEKGVYDKFTFAGISNNSLTLHPVGDEIGKDVKPTYTVASLEDEWVHLAVSFHVDQVRCPACSTVYNLTIDNNQSFECTCTVSADNPDSVAVPVVNMEKVLTARIYFSGADSFNPSVAKKAPGRTDAIDLNNTYYYEMLYTGISSIQSIYVGIPANDKTKGHSYCIDNVKLYNGVKVPTRIPAYLGYGLNVDTTQAKTEQIIGSTLGKTAIQYISEGLAMKVDFDYCIDAGDRRAILSNAKGAYGAPVKIDEEVYVPLQAILDWIGYPMFQHEDGLSFDISTDNGSTFIAIGRKTATVNGKLVELKAAPGVATDAATGASYVVISKDDVANIFSGYYATYDDMGLIVVSEGENIFNRESDLEIMLDVMKGLLYNNLTAQQYYDLAKSTTSSFAHPYIIADQEQFDTLKEAYASTEDEALKSYLEEVIANAETIFNDYSAIPKIATPQEGVPFKLAVFQKTLGETRYFVGRISGGALVSSDKSSEAVDTYLENVYGEDGVEVIGYRLYFYNENDKGKKTYIRLYEVGVDDAGIGTALAEFVDRAPKEYYTYNTAVNTLTTMSDDQQNAYYFGSTKKLERFSATNFSQIAVGNKVDVTEFPMRLVNLITSNSDAYGEATALGVSGKNNMYEYLFDTVQNPYANVGNNGYDGGGRNPFLVEVTEHMKLFAFAYQITGEEKYATIAYELFSSIALYTHWAPAHFLDCSDATANVAIAYDWLYNVWTKLGYDVREVESVMYKNGLLIGYNYTTGMALNESLLSNNGIAEIYNAATNSWNVIGTSNMAIVSLALLGTDYLNNGYVYVANPKEGEENENTTELDYVKAALTVLTSNYDTLTQLGLDMYAPDGAFIESPTKWSDATSALMLLSWTFNNALGTDLGLANTWALDKTFYYVYQIEYKTTDGYKYWNYHYSEGDYVDNSLAYYTASVLGDDGIAAIRTEQIGFKPASMWDILAYDVDYVSAEINGSKLQLDYTITGCEGVISRSDWSEDALYIGVMGNANDAPGGQIDSGNFIYANKGIVWFGDLGAETHTVYGYSDISYRHGYYRETAEGANTVILLSTEELMPYGQAVEAGGYLEEYYTSEYGMYAIIDNADVYLDKTTYAKRGVLLTNNRKTVVVQDEILFKTTERCAWVAQLGVSDAKVSADGQTVTMTHRNEDGIYNTVKVSLLDPSGRLKFEIMDAYENILSSLHRKEDSQRAGEMYTAERDRSSLKKLVVRQDTQSALSIAIVIEADGGGSSIGYEYKTIDEWNPSIVTEKFVASEIKTDVFPTPSTSSVVQNASLAEAYINSGDALYAARLEDFYRALAKIHNCEFYIGLEGGIYMDNEAQKAYRFQYLEYKQRYEKFQKEVNSYINETKKIAAHLSGYEK